MAQGKKQSMSPGTGRDTGNRETVFENAKRIARVVTQTFGRNAEVAVHDFRDLEHSLIHLEGTITRREVGAPVTDLVVKAWRAGGNEVEDMVNYRTQTKDGREMKSSTIFLRDEAGTIIGALCINFDTTELSNTVSLLQGMAQIHDVECDHPKKTETFANNVLETNEALMAHAVQIVGKHPSTMDKAEKLQCLAVLENSGAFLIKGTVDYVAECMGISKYTVYSYLKQIRSGAKTEGGSHPTSTGEK